MKFYKALLKFIQIFVVCVVLQRVASFVGLLGNNPAELDFHDLIRFAFAASLGLGTIATAYFSDDSDPPEYDDEPHNPRERKRREREAVYYATMKSAAPYARRAMWLVASLDGTFNLADAFYGASLTGLLNPQIHGNAIYLYGGATMAFGLSPTILAMYLSKVIAAEYLKVEPITLFGSVTDDLASQIAALLETDPQLAEIFEEAIERLLAGKMTASTFRELAHYFAYRINFNEDNNDTRQEGQQRSV